MQTLHTLVVEATPMDMPERIEVDISHMEELDQDVRVSDISVDRAITILTDSEELVVRVNAPRVSEDAAAAQPEEAEEAPGAAAEEAQEEESD